MPGQFYGQECDNISVGGAADGRQYMMRRNNLPSEPLALCKEKVPDRLEKVNKVEIFR